LVPWSLRVAALLYRQEWDCRGGQMAEPAAWQNENVQESRP
jgi:hypothetical protein